MPGPQKHSTVYEVERPHHVDILEKGVNVLLQNDLRGTYYPDVDRALVKGLMQFKHWC